MVTRDQFKILVMALTASYRTFKLETKEQFDLWYELLKDIPHDKLAFAVKQHIATEKWQPTIADLRKHATETTQKLLTSDEAWGEVQNAIRKHGYYNLEKALNSMSPETRRVASNMNLRELCLSENQMADRAHFIKMYNQYTEQEAKNQQLPEPMKQQLSNQNKLKQLTNGIGE